MAFTPYHRSFWICAAYCLCLGALFGCQEKPVHNKQNLTVRYIELSGEPFPLSMELSGRVSAFTLSEVRPQVNGIIKERLFEEGSDVTEGQILYRIDPELYQATFNEAKAALNKAEANAVALNLKAQRYAGLVKSGAVGKQDYDDALAAARQGNAEIASARESLETARINLGYTEVRSPVSGRIGASHVTTGALVTRNQEQFLATVQQLSPVYIDVTQSTAELLTLREKLARGQLTANDLARIRVRLILENGSPYVRLGQIDNSEPAWIEGRFMFSDVTVQQSTGVISFRAVFDNPDNLLLPGMYVRAIIDAGVRQNAVLIPQKSVFKDNRGNPQVYVLRKDVPADLPEERRKALAGDEFYAHLRPLVIGDNRGSRWMVESGLKAGELLMTDGLQKVRPGSVVSGVPTDEALASTQTGNQGR